MPFANACVRVAEVGRRDLFQRDQDIVIRMFRNEIARRGRTVKHDRSEITAVRRLYIVNECVELVFHRFLPVAAGASAAEVTAAAEAAPI